MSVTTAQAISLLENVLFESKTLATANAAGWVSLSVLQPSYSTVAGLASAMASTAEATIAQQVIRYYEGALGRAPSGAEVAYYVNIVENGNTATGIPAMTAAQINDGASAVPAGTWDKIAGFFAASPEFAFASAGGNVVNLLYLNILGRAPNAAEITYYQNLLTAGTTVSTLVQYFTTSPEYQTKVDAQIQTGLTTYGTTVANGGSSTGAVVPVLGGTTGATTVALTTGVDTITGTANVTINGTDTTLTALDSIALTGGGNVFNLNDVTGSTADLTKLQSVSGVQTLNLTSSKGLLAATTDVSSWTGLTAANFKLLGLAANTAVTAAATTAVSLTAVDAAASHNLIVNGGSTVTVADSHGAAETGVITVNGVKGTTSVSVTESGTGAGGAVNIYDVNYPAGVLATTAVASTLTAVTLDGVGATAIKSDALANLTLNNLSSTITVTDASTKGTLNVAVAHDTGAATLAASGAFTTIDVTTSGKNSALKITAANDKALNVAGSSVLTVSAGSTFAAGTTVAVSGAAGLTIDTTGLGGGTIASITSTSTGVITATVDGTATAFTGGAGQDIVTIAAAATQAIVGGTATNNEIVWNGAAAPASLGTISGFTTFGIGASYADNTSAVIDLSSATLKSFTALDVVGGNADGTTVVFGNVAAGTALSISGSLASATTTATDSVTYKIAGAAGASSSVGLTLNKATAAAGITVDSLTLVDSSAHGIGTVSVTSQASATSLANTITTLTDNALSVLNVAGSADFTVTNAIATTATSLTINATETGDNGVTLGGFTSTGGVLTSLTFTGSAAVTVGTLTDAVATGSLTVTDSSSGDVTITTATIASVPTLTLTNSGSGHLVITNAVTDNLASTLDLNGSVKLSFIDGLTSGVTVAGSTDSANVTLSLTGAVATKSDSITLGGGNDSVTVTGAGTGTETITLGNGGTSTTVQTVDVHTTGGKAIISVGTGMNDVVVGTGLNTVTYGAHTSSATTFDTLDLSHIAAASFTPATTASQTAVNAGALDVITGLQLGDKLTFGANVTAVTTSAANGLAGVSGDVALAHGDFNSTTGIFTLDASGHDTLVTYATTGGVTTYGDVVLVGVTFTSTGSTIGGHVLTLG